MSRCLRTLVLYLFIAFLSYTVIFAAEKKSAQKEKVSKYTDPTTGMEFVYVNGGCYQRGDHFGDGHSDEKPAYEVCVNNFYMGKYEVTVGEWKKFVKDTGYSTDAEQGDGCYYYTGGKWQADGRKDWRNPGYSQDNEYPVVCVSWNDANAFRKWLAMKTGKNYRLPTEAEWEYAARSGGAKEKYSGGNDIDRVAWYSSNAGGRAHAVGVKTPNGLGIHDMSGNVWEWVQDWYGEKYYSERSRNNPEGPHGGTSRVLRGGSWYDVARDSRTSNRYGGDPDGRGNVSGFRLARTP